MKILEFNDVHLLPFEYGPLIAPLTVTKLTRPFSKDP
jgi:hypothetical protein